MPRICYYMGGNIRRQTKQIRIMMATTIIWQTRTKYSSTVSIRGKRIPTRTNRTAGETRYRSANFISQNAAGNYFDQQVRYDDIQLRDFDEICNLYELQNLPGTLFHHGTVHLFYTQVRVHGFEVLPRILPGSRNRRRPLVHDVPRDVQARARQDRRWDHHRWTQNMPL